MKKTIIFILTIGMILSLAACASQSSVTSSNTAPAASSESAVSSSAPESSEATSIETSTGETPKVAFIPDGLQDESQAYAAKQFQKYGKDYGLDVRILDGQGDAQVQTKLITSAISQGYKVIMVNPADVNAVVPAIKEAHEAGLGIGMFSTDLPEEARQYRDFWVGANHVESGKTAAKAMIEHFPDGAKVVEIGGQAGHNAAIGRHDGFTEAIKGSNIEVLAYQSCKTWATDQAMAIMEDFITKYGDKIQGVFCHWDGGLTGCIQAMSAANLKDVFSVGIDGNRAGFAQVKAGTQNVCIMQNFKTQATKSLEVTEKFINGENYDKETACAWDIVAKDNVDQFEEPEW
jgi:ABC-type sugar transport system substrate-binding protein